MEKKGLQLKLHRGKPNRQGEAAEERTRWACVSRPTAAFCVAGSCGGAPSPSSAASTSILSPTQHLDRRTKVQQSGSLQTTPLRRGFVEGRAWRPVEAPALRRRLTCSVRPERWVLRFLLGITLSLYLFKFWGW